MSIEELYRYYLSFPQVTTDSRKVPRGSIFFALRGEKFDGNAYVPEALKKGASWAVSDDARYSGREKVILVENVLDTLQKLALHHRRQLNIPVLALTGSNGKTTTKELMASILSARYKVFATSGNLNNHIGVPLSLLSLNQEHELAVIEMGANHSGEIDLLCHLAEPGYGLITNIGKAHLEGFGSLDGVLKAKTELFRYMKKTKGTVFVNCNDPLLRDEALKEGLEIQWYGEIPPGNCSARMLSADPVLELEIAVLESDGLRSGKSSTQLAGSYNVQNILAAVSAGMKFGVPFHNIRRAIEQYEPHNQRSQWLRTGKNDIYLDTYNANPTSMEQAIRSFMDMQSEPKSLILGDMLELGDYAEEEHKRILNMVTEMDTDTIILVGPWFYNLAKDHRKVICFEDVNKAEDWLRAHPLKDQTILVKGSRKIGLEHMIHML